MHTKKHTHRERWLMLGCNLYQLFVGPPEIYRYTGTNMHTNTNPNVDTQREIHILQLAHTHTYCTILYTCSTHTHKLNKMSPTPVGKFTSSNIHTVKHTQIHAHTDTKGNQSEEHTDMQI